MTLPNFLIIGAAKSGTTAIYTYIKQHPEIFMSTPKELRFFSFPGSYPEGLDEKYIHKGVTTLEEYISHFDDVKDEKAIGEASPMYIYTPGAAEKIKATVPNIKLLAILRNPADRAYSAYTHAIREWNEPSETFRSALEKEPDRIAAGWGLLWHYTNAGFYFEQLDRYFKLFKPEQIKVVLYDDLVKDSTGLMTDIFAFLDVDAAFVPDTSTRPNVSGFPKSPGFHKFMYRLFMEDNLIKRVSRIILPKKLRQDVMVNMRLMNLEKKKMPKEIRIELNDLFREDIRKLEKLINRDLSFWVN